MSTDRERADAVLELQTVLAQWGADLDALQAIEHTEPLAWDGQALRLQARKAVILGDMLELGDWSRDEHRHVVRLAARDTQARILLVGEHFAEARRSLDPLPPNVTCFPTRQELEEHLDRNPLSGSLILVKGSRGIGLEHLTGRL